MREESYFLKFGAQQVRMMSFAQKDTGEQLVIFHLHGGGFHITKHPLANPHMKNVRTGFRQELDIAALRAHDWNADLPEVRRAFEALFYWPTHRADLIAFPGPPGKTWIEGFEDVVSGPDFDVVAYFRLVLGQGTIYKVGYRERNAFFATDLGRGSLIWDKMERRVGFWAGAPFPGRPLFGFRPEDGPFFIPMPRTVREWKPALDYEMEAGAEEFFEVQREKFESLFEGVAPQLEEFARGLRFIRWGEPRGRTG